MRRDDVVAILRRLHPDLIRYPGLRIGPEIRADLEAAAERNVQVVGDLLLGQAEFHGALRGRP